MTTLFGEGRYAPSSAMSRSSLQPRALRVLRVDLGALRGGSAGAARRASLAEWGSEVPDFARLGGGALGLAWIAQAARGGRPAPLVVSVGECVKRGAPTAARASVASRSPLTGLFAEGLVGGELARRLASVADALALESSEAEPRFGRGDVLVVEADASVRLERDFAAQDESPRALHARLRERFGACAVLANGPAGRRGVAFANLAASGDTPHFVGRGGLGAALGRLGLAAVCVRAPSVASRTDSELTQALLASPRLAARAEGGTFEQLASLGASGELRARAFERELDAASVRELARDIGEQRTRSHGCHGCPTPCGWEFRTSSGGAQPARFGASYALGLNLGLERFDDALALLALCDELGLDAKEAGAALALLALAAQERVRVDAPHFGARAGFERVLRECVEGASELGRLVARGPRELARALGLELRHTCAKGASVRPDDNLAALLGQCVSSRGGDSMRTFPFQSFDAAQLREWCSRGGFELAEEAFDPRAPRGKGLLVAWHEDWSNALDALGFCSFSAAALLSDGVTIIDALEAALAPQWVALRGRGALLRAGAELSLAQRELNRAWGASDDDERPHWARARLDAPGVLPEYLAVRAAQRAGRWSWSAAAFESTGRAAPSAAPGASSSAATSGATSATTGAATSATTSDTSSQTASDLARGNVSGTARATNEPRSHSGRGTPSDSAPRAGARDGATGARGPGRVRVRGIGAAAALHSGGRALEALEVALELPCTAQELLTQLAERVPAAAPALVNAGRPVANVARGGALLAAGALVRDGDELDIVAVVSGG